VDICPEHCLRLVGLAQIQGDDRFDLLLARSPAAASAIIKDEEKCVRCALCAQRCPTGAITMESLEQQEREVFE
jgi:NAD-dependent dihydropyrimidine dehydrogenase PreA subunit